MPITALTPSQRDPARLIIKVDGKPVGTLPAKEVAALGLETGGPWDAEIAAKVADCAAVDKAFGHAMRLINRRPLSRAALQAKLAVRGHQPATIDRVIARLTAIGAIDDAALGRDLLDELDRRRPAGPAMQRARLAHRGLDEQTIDELISDSAADPAAQADAARRLIDSRAKAMARLDPVTRHRRLTALLARRGFDFDLIESLLGSRPGGDRD